MLMNEYEMVFYKLSKADLREVTALEQECFSMPWNEEQFGLAFDRKIFHVFGFRNSLELIAYTSFYHTAAEMEILNIAVRPQYRTMGLAKKLLGLVLQIGRKMGINKAYLEVRTSNIPALALYKGFGFEQAGVRKKYYTDTGEDALVLHLDMQAQACGARSTKNAALDNENAEEPIVDFSSKGGA